MRIQIATDLERDNVFAEIFYKEEEWCEVYLDNNSKEAILSIWSNSPIEMPLHDAIEALQQAIKRLQFRPSETLETDEGE